jgi:16S rRNA (guanine(966)-N(2))-methyltransferase RsmD
VIGGRFRGRRLSAPPGSATRPTGDRVREALFSILVSVQDERVLDLFAGSGALAIEALSRGAASATLVDHAGDSIAAIRGNLAALEVEAEVRRESVTAFLRRAREAGRQYDLVFVDPPYGQASAIADALSAALPVVLAPGARVVTESSSRAPLELRALELRDERSYGETLIRIYRVPTS